MANLIFMSRSRLTYRQIRTNWLHCLILLLLSNPFAQAQVPLIDSLKHELEQSPHDSTRILIYLDLYEALPAERLEEAEHYLIQAVELGKLIENRQYYFEALFEYGVHLITYEASIEISLPILLEALDIAKNLKDEVRVAATLYEIAEAYYYAGQLDNAFLFYKDGLKFCQRRNFKDQEMLNLLALGNILDEKGDSDEAIYYYEKGQRIAEQQRDSIWMGYFYNNIADISREKKNFKNAIFYFTKALNVLNTPEDLCLVYANLGQLYTTEKKFVQAKENLEKALELGLEYKIIDELFNVYTRWGDYYTDLGQFEKAFAEFDKVDNLISKYSKDYLDEFNAYVQIDLYKSKATAYEKAAVPERALQYYHKYQSIEDSLFNKEKRNLLLSLDTKYKMEQKEIENKLLKIEAQAYRSRMQKNTITLVATVFIAILSVVFAYFLFLYSNRRKFYAQKLEEEVKERTEDLKMANLKLERSNSELESFASISSHDLKEPLRTIAGFTSMLESNFKNNNYENAPVAIDFIKTNVQRMFRLVEDVLAYSKADDKDEIQDMVTFQEIQRHVEDNLITLKEETSAEINFELMKTEMDQLMLPAKLKIVFKNLVENGIKYNNSTPPKVNIHLENKGKTYVFLIQDNGIGIEKQYHETIFKMFKRLHTRDEYSGTGIGLANCKKIIESLGGKLFLQKSNKSGSVFIVEIPQVDYNTK